jgi:hypothetical protein
MQETTARKMFDARFSLDGCGIALSWRGRGRSYLRIESHGGATPWYSPERIPVLLIWGGEPQSGFTKAAWRYYILQQ